MEREEEEIKSGEKVGVTGVKLTARISNLIKIKNYIFLICLWREITVHKHHRHC